jgi:NADPH-dependent 2,4-dienoyl-CoA reductase/sulfur reductase-like enzyme
VQGEVLGVTIEQIEQFKHDYLQCVKNAVEAGFDAIELHLTNGYFFSSFISGRTNRRTDEYGGAFEGRMKLPTDIISMIRREIGSDLPLLARVSVCEVNRGRSLEESRLVACALQDAGVDMLDLNIGSMCEFDYEFPPYLKQQGFALNEMEDLRRSLHIPVIAGSRLTEPAMAEQLLRDDRADLVYVNRQHIADPEWVKKAAGGETNLIRRCIGCTRCIDSIATPGMRLICSVNPFVGHESDWIVRKAEKRSRVVVVGGGPAGLQAASLHAQQGQDTILLEKESSFGGMAKAASMPPMKWEIAGFVASLVHECRKYGVDMRPCTEATVEMIKALKPDKVVLATGAEHAMPPVDGIDNDCVIKAVDLLEGRAWPGQKVAIVGGGVVGCDTADFLTDYARDITIFEMLDEIGIDMWIAAKISTIDHLKQYGARMNSGCEILSVNAEGVVQYRFRDKEYTEQFDTIVLAAGMKSVNPFEDDLRGQGFETLVIGDARQPGRFHESLVDAVKCALNL